MSWGWKMIAFFKLKKEIFLILSMVLFYGLMACGPSQAEIDATATQAAFHNTASQTARSPAPTDLPTATPAPSKTPRPTSTLTPLPPTASPTPQPTATEGPQAEEQTMETVHLWLVGVEELNLLSEDIGIMLWELEEDFVGEAQTCRTFLGQSWSASPNLAINCVWRAAPDVSFEEGIVWLSDVGIISETARSLESSYEYEGEFALYTDEASNGHAVYDGFLLDGGFLYWASVSIGRQLGETPESIFEKYDGALDTFIDEVLAANLEKRDLPPD